MDAEEGEYSDIIESTLSTDFQNARIFEGAGIYDIITSVIFILFALFTLFSNVFVMVVLHRARNRFENVMRSLIQALAITDLIGGVICCVLQTLYSMFQSFPFARNICEGLPVNALYLILTSLYLLCLINIYKCIMVTNPLFVLRHVTVKRMRVAVFLVNVLVFCFITPIIPLRLSGTLEHACSGIDQDGGEDPDVSMNATKHVGVILVTALIVSLIILTTTNAKLLTIAWRSARRLAKSNSRFASREHSSEIGQIGHQNGALNVGQNTRRSPGLKGVKTMLVVTLMLYLSCIPFCVTLALAMESEKNVESVNVELAFILLLGNCWWNALIFLFTSRTFREEAMKMKNDFKGRFKSLL